MRLKRRSLRILSITVVAVSILLICSLASNNLRQESATQKNDLKTFENDVHIRVKKDGQDMAGPVTSLVTQPFSTTHTREYKMVVGILTAKRDQPTVVRMAEQLAKQVHRNDYKLVAWVSHSASREESMIKSLEAIGFTVGVNRRQYPELAEHKIRITYNDTVERVLWRTSHVLDYANLLRHTQRYKADCVVILEDDLKPAKFALDKAYDYCQSTLLQSNRAYLTLFTGGTTGWPGACAMMLARSLVSDLIHFLRTDPYKAPIDLLQSLFADINHLRIQERSPNLFQHISPQSSYSGQDQRLRNSERIRSVSFRYDEDNTTLSDLPVRLDGYIGCFKDMYQDRDMNGLYAYHYQDLTHSRSSPFLCNTFCKNYIYYGLQNGEDCHCSNEFGQHGWAPASDCNMPCKWDPRTTCGGKLRNSVHKVFP